MLTSVSLLRGLTEQQTVHRFVDTQQAFWNAEGGLDDVLRLLNTDPTLLTPDTDIRTDTGGYSYRIETSASTLVPPDAIQLIQQIVVTGKVLGPSQEVLATREVRGTIAQQRKFAGVGTKFSIGVSNDPLGAVALDPTRYLQIQGELRSELGTLNMIDLDEVQITGPIAVGPSAPYEGVPPYDILYGVNPNPVNGADLLGGNFLYPPPPYPAVTVHEGFHKAILSEAPQTAPLAIQSWADPAFDPIAQAATPCAHGSGTGMSTTSGIEVGRGRELVIGDGHACDLSGPGDGKIVIATDHIFLQDQGSSSSGGTLTFTSPATVYLTGRRHPTTAGDLFWGAGYVMKGLSCVPFNECGHGAYYQGKSTSLKAVQGATTLTDGVRLVVPPWAYDQRPVKDWEMYHDTTNLDDVRYYTDFEVYGGEFVGSIWAPWSDVVLYIRQGTPPPIRPSRVISKFSWMYGDKQANTSISFQSASTGSPPQMISLLCWRSD